MSCFAGYSHRKMRRGFCSRCISDLLVLRLRRRLYLFVGRRGCFPGCPASQLVRVGWEDSFEILRRTSLFSLSPSFSCRVQLGFLLLARCAVPRPRGHRCRCSLGWRHWFWLPRRSWIERSSLGIVASFWMLRRVLLSVFSSRRLPCNLDCFEWWLVR